MSLPQFGQRHLALVDSQDVKGNQSNYLAWQTPASPIGQAPLSDLENSAKYEPFSANSSPAIFCKDVSAHKIVNYKLQKTFRPMVGT